MEPFIDLNELLTLEMKFSCRCIVVISGYRLVANEMFGS